MCSWDNPTGLSEERRDQILFFAAQYHVTGEGVIPENFTEDDKVYLDVVVIPGIAETEAKMAEAYYKANTAAGHVLEPISDAKWEQMQKNAEYEKNKWWKDTWHYGEAVPNFQNAIEFAAGEAAFAKIFGAVAKFKYAQQAGALVSKTGGHISKIGGKINLAIRGEKRIAELALRKEFDAILKGRVITTNTARGATLEPMAHRASFGPKNSTKVFGSTEPFDYFPNNKNGIMSELTDGGIIEFKINAVDSPVSGSELFSKMMSHYGDNVNGIRGVWVSTDLTKANKNLGMVNKLTSQGVSLEQAVTKAWTAEKAVEYGFTNVVIETAKGVPGNYSKLHVLFTK